MDEKAMSCVETARGPLAAPGAQKALKDESQVHVEEVRMAVARVGAEAPDFEANAFADGQFKTIRLSDYRGQWVVLCFYPGDFTFV